MNSSFDESNCSEEISVSRERTKLKMEQLLRMGRTALDERRVKAPDIVVTEMDLQALRDMAARSITEKANKLREELESRPVEPIKPIQPKGKFRPATACSCSWDKMAGSGRIKYCERCKLHVYDFSEMEFAAIKELVFKQEGKKKFALYERKDSKFLTSNRSYASPAKRFCVVAAASVLVAAVWGVLAINWTSSVETKMVSSSANLPARIASQPAAVPAAVIQNKVVKASHIDKPSESVDNEGVDVQLPEAPRSEALLPLPNSGTRYPSSHNPREFCTNSIADLPALPALPKYSGTESRVVSTSYHPYLRGGKQCYEQNVMCKEDSGTVITWFHKTLENNGWQFEAGEKESVNAIARRPQDGAIAVVHVRSASGQGYRSAYTLRYIKMPVSSVQAQGGGHEIASR